jgi:hypothetical protein
MGRKHLNELDVDGLIMLRRALSEVGCEGVHWILLAQTSKPR